MNKRWAVSVVIAVAVGMALGFGLSSLRSGGKRHESAPANVGEPESGERKVLYWHDPMVPGTKFDKPGKSPFMGMQLVPVYADETDAGGSVRINASLSQNLGIRLGPVEKAVLHQQLRAVGGVTFDDRLLELVQARVSGYVTRLHVKAPFEHVRRGQPLAEILSPEWLAAQQEYLALLESESASARGIRESARQRLIVLGVPEATIRAIETDRKTHPTTTMFAPIDGIVTELSVREGSAFVAGAPLFRVNGLASVWVNAQVPEARISMIPVGAHATAHATAWPGDAFTGQVIALLPEVDPQTRTLTARVALENPRSRLSPGMYVSLELAGSENESQLLVPSEAVIMTGERSVVIVAREGGGFDVVNVTIGPEANGKTTILSGLTEDQSVVLSGQFLIDSEASLKSTVSRMETGSDSANAVQTPAGAMAQAMPPEGMHVAEGTIQALTADQITIAHGPVSSLGWPAMTMAFKRPTGSLPEGLKVGDRVSFSFSRTPQGGFQIERIEALGERDASEPSGERRR